MSSKAHRLHILWLKYVYAFLECFHTSDHVQFQAGAFDPWGGPGFAACASLINHEFERVFYKNNFSFRVAIFNLYMVLSSSNLRVLCALTLLPDIWWH